MAAQKVKKILERQLALREKLWPGVANELLWYRKDRDGFATVPRAMPLIMSIMDDLAGKGFPVGQTYLEMWCRLFDESFLTLHRPEELAFHAGFSGQRAVRTWRDRIRRLNDLGFIDVRPGPIGEFSYVLFWNPYHVIRKHHDAGRVNETKWNALVVRATEIGATDLDQKLSKPIPPEELSSGIEILCAVQFAHFSPYERILLFGGKNPDGTQWQVSHEDAINGIETGKWKFYVNVGGKFIWVVIATNKDGKKYLKTEADVNNPDNLLNLPACS